MEQLCEANKLSELTLRKVDMNDQIVKLLVEFIEDGYGLKKLDISWSQLNYHQCKPILECLASNRVLSDVNVSWNTLAE